MSFESQGVLRYSILESGVNYKLTLIVDPGIAAFYRSIVPKHEVCKPGRHAPHITVVRNELPANMKNWGLHEGLEIEFEYDPLVWYDGTYWWLDCYSEYLEDVRVGLGLSMYSKWNSPPSMRSCFHMTIGNSK